MVTIYDSAGNTTQRETLTSSRAESLREIARTMTHDSTEDVTEEPVIGVFGGSFNPPHLSHVLALAVVHARFNVEKLLVVPTYQHPFAKSLAPYEDRVAMCELAMGWIPRVEVSRVEEELGGESRTVRMLEHLASQHPGRQLRFVMGADIMMESAKWYRFDRIVELAPPIVLGRVGIEYPGAPPPVLPEISSTEIRAKLAAGDLAPIEELVPRAVLAYAQTRGLYKNVD